METPGNFEFSPSFWGTVTVHVSVTSTYYKGRTNRLDVVKLIFTKIISETYINFNPRHNFDYSDSQNERSFSLPMKFVNTASLFIV